MLVIVVREPQTVIGVFNQIQPVKFADCIIDFLDRFLGDVIVFVPDVSDQFFQNIFHRQQTGCPTVFVNHNRQMNAFFHHLVQNFRNGLVFRNKQDVAYDFA